MSEDLMLKCLIAFILGWLVSRMMGNGFQVGCQEVESELLPIESLPLPLEPDEEFESDEELEFVRRDELDAHLDEYHMYMHRERCRSQCDEKWPYFFKELPLSKQYENNIPLEGARDFDLRFEPEEGLDGDSLLI